MSGPNLREIQARQRQGCAPQAEVEVHEAPAFSVTLATLAEIRDLRDAYRREMACQIIHDSWHARGFADSYLLKVDGRLAGYGSVGGPPREPRDTVKELYVLPEFRALALTLFRALAAASSARHVEAQTNDTLLLLMLLDCASTITSETLIFADAATTNLVVAGASFRQLTEEDHTRVFLHSLEPVGEYGLELNGQIVATGGLLYHYNPPYGDIYMEVDPAHRRRGLGSYLVQQLKRLAHEGGHIPVARCRDTNCASRRTLQRAGMLPCARIVRGRLDQ
jgi:GNAT superfamily N-acetyltransferase